MKTTKLLAPCLVAATLSPAMSAQAASKKEAARKNVLFIAVDDLKPLLGCYGDPVAKTPNIDNLASRGALFSSSYCQQAVSGPTRASLMTGTSPDRTQVWDLQTLIRDKNPNALTLPQYMRQNGYETVGIGKIYDPRSVDKKQDDASWSTPYLDYEEFFEPGYSKPLLAQYQSDEVRTLVEKYTKEATEKGKKNRQIVNYVQQYVKPSTECANVPDRAYSDGAIAEGAAEYLNKYNGEKPLFLAVGFKRPHLPFVAPKKYWDMYKREQMPLAAYRQAAVGSPDFAYHNNSELASYSDIPPVSDFSDIRSLKITDEKARELIHGYYASVSYMDAQLGKVIEALDKKGMRENTIIVLWGDHGWHLGDHGLWNKHTNFEQATRTPLIIIDPSMKPAKIENPVEFLDIFPTVVDLAGLKLPEGLQGYSLTGLMKNPGKAQLSQAYAVSQFPRGPRMGYSLRDGRYRYTVWLSWKDRQLDMSKVLAVELYDYQKDPNETVNVAESKEYAKARAQMEVYWKDFAQKRLKK